MQTSLMSRKQGSAMVGAIIIAIIIGTWVAASVSTTFTEYKLSKRYFDSQNAMNLAESGLEEGIRLLQSGNWGSEGWTSYGSGYYKSFAPAMADGASAIKVYVQDDPSAPVIVSEGSIAGSGGTAITRQIKVELKASSSGSTNSGYAMFANAMLARREVIFNGNNVLVDSYDSRLGSYTPSSFTNRFSNGHVVSLDVSNPQIHVNNADVRGYVSTGSSRWSDNVVGPQGTVHAYGYRGGKIDHSRITTDFYMELPSIPQPENLSGVENLGVLNSAMTLGSPTSVGPKEYKAERVQLSGNNTTITINGPVRLYVERNFDISGNKSGIVLTENGSLELFVREELKISGNGIANSSGKPEKLLIYGGDMAHQSIHLGGNAQLYACVYAPNANVHMNGGGSSGVMCGAIVANQITLNGHWNFHYDEALKDFRGGGDSGGTTGVAKLTMERWRELRTAGERVDFSNPASISSKI